MPTLLRALRLLSMVIWVGGLVFFAFILAPVAFHLLPTSHEAGLVVGGTLVVLHRVGAVCGAVFLLSTALMRRATGPATRFYVRQLVLIVGMLALTAVLQRSILPRMDRDRSAFQGDLAPAPSGTAAHRDFDRLHVLSERLEGGVLLGGLAVVLLMAAEPRPLRG